MVVKKIQIFVLISSVLLSFCFVSHAQENEILLINGKRIEATVIQNDGEFLKYEFKKKDNLFVKEIDLLRVYSFTKNKNETVVYKKDTALGNVFSQDEMRMFIYGESDAEETIKSWPYVVSGFAVGYGVSILDTYSGKDFPETPENDKGFFKSAPSMVHFAVPFVFPIVCGKIKPKVKSKHVSDDLFLVNEQFLIGFQKNARFKRIMGGLVGSLSGTVLGIVTYAMAGE